MAKTFGRFGFVPLLLLALSGSASGQDYPSKPIRLVVPYPAGGVVDFVARQIGQKWLPPWDNRSSWKIVSAQAERLRPKRRQNPRPMAIRFRWSSTRMPVNPHIYKNLR